MDGAPPWALAVCPGLPGRVGMAEWAWQIQTHTALCQPHQAGPDPHNTTRLNGAPDNQSDCLI